ncbi:recombinase family protein [Streptomyces sp. NPDC059010]|uniref:recombinase family protein n=1 Tax=Streptomyces sp. NPDC059010 TaxID=3346695 RepID=UPI0036AC5F2C
MPRLFGFQDMAYRRVRESEAEGIRLAASRRLLEQSFPDICEAVNAGGWRTTQGNPFKPDVLARILHHPAIAGLMENEDGELVDSGGPRIIPAEDFLTIRAMRQTGSPDGKPVVQRDNLLSGPLGVCGMCATTLVSAPSNAGSRGHRCPPSTAQHPGGCGKVRINAERLETYLAENVLAELAKPEVSALIGQVRDRLLAEAAELRKQVAASKRRQKKLGEDYARSGMSTKAFKAADKELTEQIRGGAAKARFLEQVKHVPVGDVADLVRWWKHAPLAAKRGVLVLMLEQVAVYPAASRGSRTVDADRVALKWRVWDSAPSTSAPSTEEQSA